MDNKKKASPINFKFNLNKILNYNNSANPVIIVTTTENNLKFFETIALPGKDNSNQKITFIKEFE